MHWPIVGDLTSPSLYPKSLCLSKAKKYADHGDKMPGKVAQLRSMLLNASGTATALYFHCDAGMDRTGEMYGDYMMTYKNQSYAEVYAFDNDVENPPRDINTVNKQALEWMCLYLREAEGVPQAVLQCNMCT